MVNAKCRFCDHAADVGAYCSTWTAAIMAKALNLFFGGIAEEEGKLELPQRGLRSTEPVPVMKGPLDIRQREREEHERATGGLGPTKTR